MTKSSNHLPDFKPEEWRKACSERRKIRERLTAIKSQLKDLEDDHDLQSIAIDALYDDAFLAIAHSVVPLQEYRDYKSLIVNAEKIRNNLTDTETGLRNEQVALESRLEQIENGIQSVKQIFRSNKGKVIPFERQRSETASRQ